jgi:hypothetical protein
VTGGAFSAVSDDASDEATEAEGVCGARTVLVLPAFHLVEPGIVQLRRALN